LVSHSLDALSVLEKSISQPDEEVQA
jgi:hypothetical protein